MRPNHTLLLLLVTTYFVQAQDTGCEEDFKYVSNFIESNFPGFNKDVTQDNRQNYLQFKTQLASEINKVKNKNQCLKCLTYYVEYFKDNHTKMRSPSRISVDETSTEKIAEFKTSPTFLDTERIKLPEQESEKEYPINDIRGQYISSDSTYIVQIVEDKTIFRDYAAVVVASKTQLWEKGQVKFEIKRKTDKVYEGFFYDRYHQSDYKTAVPFNSGFFGTHWFKINKDNKTNYGINLNTQFQHEVKDSTVVLRIPSFMGDYTNTIDSLYNAAKSDIENNPYLIIDVRDNGGGNSYNFYDLIPYLYTKPIIDTEITELYATKDIIALYEDEFEEMMKDSTKVNAETIQSFREGIKDLRKAKLNSFVQQGETDTITLVPKKYPKKIGILYNRGCGSACEDLLFKSKFSDKTILLGDNSGGFVGYGNIFTVYTPYYNFGLSCSTTRYSTQWKYEVVGISPDVRLNYDLDWIKQATEILKTN